MRYQIFISDLDKMTDLLEAVMSTDNEKAYEEFLHEYPDVSENMLDDTVKSINVQSLVNLYKRATNCNKLETKILIHRFIHTKFMHKDELELFYNLLNGGWNNDN